MIDKKAWSEFRTSGMLWFVNTILHAFVLVPLCNYWSSNTDMKLPIEYPIWRFEKVVAGNIHTSPEFKKPVQTMNFERS